MQLFGSTSQTSRMWELPQLSQGDNLYVDGPFSFDGTANLKIYNSNTISFDMNIKADGRILGFDVKIPFTLKNGVANANLTLNKISDNQYSIKITDNNNPSYSQTETVTASEKNINGGKEITFYSDNAVKCTMTATNGALSFTTPELPFSVKMSKTNSFGGDSYSNNSTYGTGYSQGVMLASPIANTITGLATGGASMANNLGGIFGGIINLIASILNTVVNLIAKMIDGVMGLFGVGKKDKSQGAQPINTMNQGINTQSFSGGQNNQVTPSGTNINQAYSKVQEDSKIVQNPAHGLQLMNLHAQKAKDYRDKAEQLEKEVEKQAKITLSLAQSLQKNPNDSSSLAKLQESKAKTMNLLKATKEYSQAVYDESLYVQLANDILNKKFQGAMGQNSTKLVQDTWKNWNGGATEKQFLFFNKNLRSASEILKTAETTANANIGQATQILASIKGIA